MGLLGQFNNVLQYKQGTRQNMKMNRHVVGMYEWVMQDVAKAVSGAGCVCDVEGRPYSEHVHVGCCSCLGHAGRCQSGEWGWLRVWCVVFVMWKVGLTVSMCMSGVAHVWVMQDVAKAVSGAGCVCGVWCVMCLAKGMPLSRRV